MVCTGTNGGGQARPSALVTGHRDGPGGGAVRGARRPPHTRGPRRQSRQAGSSGRCLPRGDRGAQAPLPPPPGCCRTPAPPRPSPWTTSCGWSGSRLASRPCSSRRPGGAPKALSICNWSRTREDRRTFSALERGGWTGRSLQGIPVSASQTWTRSGWVSTPPGLDTHGEVRRVGVDQDQLDTHLPVPPGPRACLLPLHL